MASGIGGAIGTGSFGAATSYDAEGTTTYALSIADINGDGKLDMITAGGSAGVGQATIRLGNGDGTFGEAKF